MDVEQNGSGEEENGCYEEVKESKSHPGSVGFADIEYTEERKWRVRILLSSAKGVHGNTGDEESENPAVEDEEHVDSVVADANTVVDPYAVVVVSLYAYIADSAVTGPCSADQFAIWAEVLRCELCQEQLEVVVLIIRRCRLESTWVTGRGHVELEPAFCANHRG